MATVNRRPVAESGVPARPRRLVARDRLLDLLRAGRHRPVTVIHAPAGYGKTTLAVQWTDELRSTGLLVAWVGLRPDDSSPPTLLGHLLEAVRKAVPDLDEPLGALAATLEQHADQAEQHVLGALLELLRRGREHLTVAFDDWHLVEPVGGASLLATLLATVLDDPAANLSVLLSGRARPALPLSRLRITDRLTEIGPELLRFDEQESRAFLVERAGLPLGRAQVRRITEGADGWVAALQLASLSLRGSTDPGEVITRLSGRHHAIGEYLAENVLDALPPEVLDLLLTTSVCDRLCAGLVSAVTGRPDGQAVLDDLDRRDLFLRPLDQEHEWFRYHQLFLDYLRRRLERDQPGRPRELHAAAAAWCAEHNMVGVAVDHAVAGGHVELAVELVGQHAMPLIEHSRMTSVIGLVGKLPAEVVSTRPSMLTALAWANCLLQRAVPAQVALDQLRSALALADRPPGPTGLLADADLIQACIDVFADRVGRAGDLVGPQLRRPDVERPFLPAVAANIQSFVDIASFRFEAALAQQQWARQFQNSTVGPFAGVYGRCFAGIAAYARLDLNGARQHLHGAVLLARASAGRQSHAAQLAGALLGEMHYERGDLADAARLLEASRELGAECGVVDFMLASFGTLARIRAVQGDTGTAFELLDEGRAVAERLNLPRLKARMIADQIGLLLETGRVREALRVAQSLPDGSACHGGIGTLVEWTRTATLGRVLSAEGNHAAAIGLLEALVERTTAAGHPLWEVRAALRLACAHQAGRFAGRAEATLAPVLRRGAGAGLLRTVLDAGPEIADILPRLAGRNPADAVPSEYLARLLALSGATPAPDPTGPRGNATLRSLSGQELQIVRMLERGLSNKEIAHDLRISVNTVKWYLKNIYTKLGVTNRAQSVFALRQGDL